MAGLILGSEDDWQSELAEHPELASLQETSLFEEGALEEALANLADGADAGVAGAGSSGAGAGGRAGAGEPTLEELLAGAVDLSELGAGAAVLGGDAAEPGAAAAGVAQLEIPPQLGFDPRHQLQRIKGLRHVVVRTDIQAQDLVCVL